MSFFSRLFNKHAGGRSPLSRPAEDRVYVVDATGLVDSRQRNGGQASPRDHFAVLRTLAQFAGREAIDIQAVFTGRPLREAGEGQEFKGVRTFYAENEASAQAKMKEMIRKLSVHKDVILLTADAALEREARELGAACMRLSTLRKSFEERDDRDRGERDRGNRGRDDRDRERQRRPANETPPAEASDEPAEEPEPKEKENPSVNDLIDPV